MDPRSGFIPILWPDREKGPYIARVRLERLAGRPEVIELVLGSIKDDRPITWEVLRRVSMPEIAAAALAALPLGGELDPSELLAGAPLNAADMDPAWAASRKAVLARSAAAPGKATSWQPATVPERQRYPDGHLEHVAAVYTEAHRVHRPPTKAVAEAWEISHAAAAKQVLRARRQGLLKPTTRGKAAGATPGSNPAARILAGTPGRRNTK